MANREPFNATAKPPSVITQRSPWHSPVPYLFGGLAAMLGLIAFALLILACSYWKLSGYLEGGEGERDLEAGDGTENETQKAPPVFEEKIFVIMAGEAKPTFLATPISSRSSSFGDGSCSTSSCVCEKSEKVEMTQLKEKEKEVNITGGDAEEETSRNGETRLGSEEQRPNQSENESTPTQTH